MGDYADYRPHLLTKVRSKKLMRAMKHYPCTLRIASFVPGESCAPRATNVGVHLPVIGKGTSTKVTDLAVACGCHLCHALQEGVDPRGAQIAALYPAAYHMRLLNGLVETHALLVQDGIIVVPDGRLV
jgi:hypothetical protein